LQVDANGAAQLPLMYDELRSSFFRAAFDSVRRIEGRRFLKRGTRMSGANPFTPTPPASFWIGKNLKKPVGF
jgi:hypothetical protein